MNSPVVTKSQNLHINYMQTSNSINKSASVSVICFLFSADCLLAVTQVGNNRWEVNGSIMDKSPCQFPFSRKNQLATKNMRASISFSAWTVKLNLSVKLQCNVKEGIIWSDKTGQKRTLQCVGELRSGINAAYFCNARSLHCRDQDNAQFEICDSNQDWVCWFDSYWVLDARVAKCHRYDRYICV